MKAYLILADGTVFEGQAAGAAGETIGEVVFQTAMGGYMETLTDPRYAGQIVANTFPLMGNYGTITEGLTDKPALKGYIVRELVRRGSNFRCEGGLNEYLEANGVVCIEGVDVRELTRRLRDKGVMNGMITTVQPPRDMTALLKRIKSYKIQPAALPDEAPTTVGSGTRVVLWNFGAPGQAADALVKRGCAVTTVPASYTAEQILAQSPAGVVVGSGAGDPAAQTAAVEQLKILLDKKIPVFGIGLGHQLLALAAGGRTKKLKYGHRGGNQPVTDLRRGRTLITSQNHGYAVVGKSLPAGAETTFINANDKTCEGVAYDFPALSVQFTPVTAGGPHDAGYIFDAFVDMCKTDRG